MYDVVDLSEDSVTFTAPVVPQMGYPYLLETAVTYSLTDDGLSVRHVLINRSCPAAPVAVGIHSFFSISDVDPDLLTLSVPADTYMVPDERLLPISEAPVDEGVDLREGLLIGDHALDFIYTSVHRDPDGWIRSTLSAPDGRRVTVRQGEGFDYIQVFTSDAFPGQRIATAIEPIPHRWMPSTRGEESAGSSPARHGRSRGSGLQPVNAPATLFRRSGIADHCLQMP